MVVYSLTNHIYTTWGVKYSSFNWRPEWYTFLRIQKRELKELEFHESFKIQTVKYLVFWFDTQILQKIGVDKDLTLKVRIRILCGLINNTPTSVLTRPMKIEFMECIWDTYNKFYKDWYKYYCRNVLELPF